MNISATHKSTTPVSLLSFKRARIFATKCGWPDDVSFSSQDVMWQIAANDNSMSVQIEIRGAHVAATVNMNYMGKCVQMIRLVFDGQHEHSEGLLYKHDVEKAFACFQVHMVNMLHGPVRIPLRESA
ncbi:MAG: hypothetical protein CTY35_00495 [Methylotenera sp.]|uniref:hypothetical protein n=1 Tax=Methylotenera sp. TaxID=2051956 RepID=UPI000D44E98A|nr:hypothetical protein [Methylotenera sp.]PPD02194.1 MAG: hypothetical protein CTY35_00495 [Methylotenera sp.]